ILTDTTFDGICLLGIIILVGVSVNNGIVLLDLIVKFRNEGLERRSAVIEACTQRMRPVIMTSVTTCVGLIPMAMGDQQFFGTPYYPLGRTILGGILFSTLVTLFAIPIFYLNIDSMWGIVRTTFKRYFGQLGKQA
ncbi:MAG: efflux RND transporter permease subunit, partial [Planctomycetes bacterium]|nr:efflux RND transporter permease subunit [Planctomycetota bacterium]